MPQPKHIAYLIAAIAGIVTLIWGIYAVNDAFTPDIQNANVSSAIAASTEQVTEILKKDQFSVKKGLANTFTIEIPKVEKVRLIAESTVKGSGEIEVQFAQDARGSCPCNTFDRLTGDQSQSFFFTNDNKIDKEVDPNKTIYVKFYTESPNELFVDISLGISYERTTYTAR